MTEKSRIPTPLIAEVADVLAQHSHTELNNRFARAGAPGDRPLGNKIDKSMEWLERANADPDRDAFAVLGRMLQELMDLDYNDMWATQRVTRVLGVYGFSYQKGGIILGATLSAPTRSLDDLLRKRDIPAIEAEFSSGDRACHRPRGESDGEPLHLSVGYAGPLAIGHPSTD